MPPTPLARRRCCHGIGWKGATSTTASSSIADYLAGRLWPGAGKRDPKLVKKALHQLGLERREDYMPREGPGQDGLSAAEQLISAGIANPTTRLEDIRRHQDSACSGRWRMWWTARRALTCPCRRRSSPSTRDCRSRCRVPMVSASTAMRDAVNIIGGYSKLQEIAERALHIKQLWIAATFSLRARRSGTGLARFKCHATETDPRRNPGETGSGELLGRSENGDAGT